MNAMPVLIIVGAILLVVLIWFIANYNRFVRLRHYIKESWADIDVELKRRYDLIPNLVETVKGYAKHEREVLERVVELRNQARANEGSAESQARDENTLLRALKTVFALSEAYPDLKADRHFLELQNELALTEDRIAAARRFFNGNVRDMRNLCEMFPTSIVANMFGFEVPTYFELDSETERIVPRVSVARHSLWVIGLAAGWIAAGCTSTLSSDPAGHSSSADPVSTERPGRQADGSILLPNQWSLRPVGRQIVLGDFPSNIALDATGQFAAVLHCGYGQHEVVVVDVAAQKVVSRVALNEAFYGITFSRDSSKLFCSGASSEVIHAFDFNNGFLSGHATIRVSDPQTKAIPAGLAVSADSSHVYVANLWGHFVSALSLPSDGNEPVRILLREKAPTGMPQRPAAATEDEDIAAITKRQEAAKEADNPADPYPYAVVLDEPAGRLYASLWGQSCVAAIDLKTNQQIARWPTQEHPNEMVLNRARTHLYVANANRNTVSVIETATGRNVETLVAELSPNAPPGNTPNSLALSPNERFLFVANADINTVAVFDVRQPGHSRSLGFIPVGWYPTSVRVTPDGKKLLVANGKGIVPKANRHGPQPGNNLPSNLREYIGGLFQGTLSVIRLPGDDEFEQRLKSYTLRAYKCSPQWQNAPPLSLETGHPVPRVAGGPTPIRYCIYIVKENRTYDQVLGDLPIGNGDPSLCLFGERVTPNHHQLAREFVLLDNFYVESEVSADGHEWSMGAYATDFVEKSWPLNYGHNRRHKFVYPSEGKFAIARPAGGYLWDRARDAGVSYRSYGEFVVNGRTPDAPAITRVQALQGHFDPWFRSFDMNYPDQKRADRFIAELQRFEHEGEMPRLQIVRLPNDHTAGTATGKLTPTALVADNDLALGRVVEAISRSKFWPQTAIFVVEDDAQNGPDHVDAHRTTAFVISPYARRGALDSTLYSTASMLRTIELILGLKPMSQFDAAAMPMFHSFQAKPDLRPYSAIPARVDLAERNRRRAWGSQLSQQMNLATEDAADDLLLNEVIWRSVRGADSPMPAPVRAGFVFSRPDHDGDDDDD